MMAGVSELMPVYLPWKDLLTSFVKDTLFSGRWRISSMQESGSTVIGGWTGRTQGVSGYCCLVNGNIRGNRGRGASYES